MSEIAISVENVSKLYHIGKKSSGSLRETLTDSLSHLFRKNKQDSDETEFWALKDVSFEIKKGEAVGIIGKNGAGKSTLLKVLSRITEPTSGKFTINGKVSSLLEVGTGFHPELTGRENIYLNGSILGMNRSEIKSKFDEIVDFSGIEKFIDTPVKRYSSGMYVRLAFSVAAHLEPDILIIDEVLAVGDAEFQKKCMGKMQDVSGQGRTVIFVSHNMIAVKNLCQKAIILENGYVTFQGTSEAASDQYLSKNKGKSELPLSDRTDRKGDGRLKVKAISINNKNNFHVSDLVIGEQCKFLLEYDVIDSIDINYLFFAIQIFDTTERVMTTISTDEMGIKFNQVPQKGTFQVLIPSLNLRAGQYYINFMISEKRSQNSPHQIIDHLTHAISFTVLTSDFYHSGVLLRPSGFIQPSTISIQQ
ncbi:MAG: ABC transporter ATP-binding protein [Bacteroidetes bacterium]|nr:ABC transporter ATP-binding protein [Bacteroidota bacterium]